MFLDNTLSQNTVNWILKNVDATASVIEINQLKGSTSSTLHRVSLQLKGEIKDVVIRQFDNKEWLLEEPDLALHEAESLRLSSRVGIATPELIAFDESGQQCGMPAILMTMLEGQVELMPQQIGSWLDGFAAALVKIHGVDATDFPWAYFTYNDILTVEVPTWSAVPEAWKKAIEFVKGPRPNTEECFIHRDYHPANVLWENGIVSGVVDWVNACRGPAGVDVGHCRLNLATLYDVETADAFLSAYAERAGKSFVYDPYWDLLSLIDVLFGPPEVYPGWVAFGVRGLTDKMMEERMDMYVLSLLNRV